MARIAQDHGIFETLAASGEPVDVQSIAAASKLEPLVLEPILDYLCVQEMAKEVAPGRLEPTVLTHQLVAPLFRDAVTHL
jgi:hypothetical protein